MSRKEPSQQRGTKRTAPRFTLHHRVLDVGETESSGCQTQRGGWVGAGCSSWRGRLMAGVSAIVGGFQAGRGVLTEFGRLGWDHL